MAERYGAIALDPEADPASKMSSLTDGRGPDCVLEVVGHPSALEAATKLVRIGGVVSSCGVHNEELVLPGPLAYGKGLRMQFGRCHARAMFPEALKLLEKISKATPHLVDEFVQKKVRLEEAPEVSRVTRLVRVVVRPIEIVRKERRKTLAVSGVGFSPLTGRDRAGPRNCHRIARRRGRRTPLSRRGRRRSTEGRWNDP